MRSVRSRGREQMASKHLLTQDKATQDKATQDKATQDKATQDKALGPPSELTQDRALELCRLMVLSRTIEDRLHALYRQGRLRGRLISGRGQEANRPFATEASSSGKIVGRHSSRSRIPVGK